MIPLVMETDLGRDPDDMFALLYLLATKQNLTTVCLSPGDPDQIAITRALLRAMGSDAKILTPKGRVHKTLHPVGFYAEVQQMLGPKDGDEIPDGHEELLPPDPVELFVCGPAKMAHLLCKPTRITFQGGFVPYSSYRPKKVLSKFEGKTTCATFNLGGTKPNVSEALINLAIPHRWVGKNICHSVLYTKAVHDSMPAKTTSALDLHGKIMDIYLKRHSEKAFHDPLAAVMSVNPEVGVWEKLKPSRIKGEWTAIPADDFHLSLVDLAADPFEAYFTGLAQ